MPRDDFLAMNNKQLNSIRPDLSKFFDKYEDALAEKEKHGGIITPIKDYKDGRLEAVWEDMTAEEIAEQNRKKGVASNGGKKKSYKSRKPEGRRFVGVQPVNGAKKVTKGWLLQYPAALKYGA